jgi:MFS family permease
MTAALSVAAMTYAISQTLIIPSIQEIETSLHTSAVGGTSLFTVFFVSGAVTLGIFGRLADMFGKRRLFGIQMALFTVGAVIAALGTSLAVVMTGRAVMGCAAAVFPLTYAILRDELPAARLPTTIALMGGMGASGAAIGQSTGGVITDHFGYQSIFWISAGMGVASFVLVRVFVPESSMTTPGRVDFVGALLLAAGLAAPLSAISEVPALGWGTVTFGLLALGAVTLTVFVRHERRHPAPLVNLAMLMNPRVRLTNAATLFVGFSLFGISVVISQFVQVPSSTHYGFGVDASHAGFFMVPGLVLMLVLAPVTGRITARYGPKLALIIGTGIGAFALAGLAFAHDSELELYIWPTLTSLGVAFAFGAAPLLILGSVPPELRGQSAAMNLVLRSIGSSLGLQIAGTFIAASTIGATGLPAEIGFTRSFAIDAVIACTALLIALAIPTRGDRADAVGELPADIVLAVETV